jgi:hypothetical protein
MKMQEKILVVFQFILIVFPNQFTTRKNKKNRKVHIVICQIDCKTGSSCFGEVVFVRTFPLDDILIKN